VVLFTFVSSRLTCSRTVELVGRSLITRRAGELGGAPDRPCRFRRPRP